MTLRQLGGSGGAEPQTACPCCIVPETKEEAMAFCLYLGFILLAMFYAARNKSPCCRSSGGAAPHNGLAVYFGYVTFSLV